jgi:lipopolysaccharide biosynthesis glycosyltransferase
MELGLSGPDVYFNTGVILMNLALMRDDDCASALRNYASRHAGELLWPDQDTLNVVLGHRRLPLHPRWNCMNSIMHLPWAVDVFGAGMVAEAQRNPAIRHFEGPTINKPWHYLCQRAMRDVYFVHRRQTPWPRFRLEGATLRNRISRMIRGSRRPRLTG